MSGRVSFSNIEKTNVLDDLATDYTARSILRKCSISGFVPGLTRVDGNCLFNAISVGIIGNEHLCTELRARTTTDMAKIGLKYTENLGRLYYVSRDYSESLVACAGTRFFLGCMDNHGQLSTLIHRDIKSVHKICAN